MTFPIQLAFHQMDRSDALERAIRDRTEKLGRIHPGITGVHIAVMQQGRQGSSRLFNVRLEVHVKGKTFAITQQANSDALVAACDAFDAAKRVIDAELEVAHVKQH